MVEQRVSVINKLGVHARPASTIVQTAIKFKSKVELIKDGNPADAKSIMSVMMLAAAMGSEIIIRADGEDAEEVVGAIIELFEKKFNEE